MRKTNLTPVVYAVLHLKKKTPAEKVAYGNYLISKITDNLNLPDPQPSLSSYQDTVTALEKAMADALSESVIDKQALETAIGAFNIETRRLASYVQNVANGFAPSVAQTIIVSAGMSIRKKQEKAPAPAAVSNLKAIFTNTPGTILAKWKGAEHARTYTVYYSLSDDLAGNWTLAGVTPRRKFEVEGLTSGIRYYIKVVAIGVNGTSPASNIATCIAS